MSAHPALLVLRDSNLHRSLNIVILRLATIYGPYNLSGIVTPRITIGRVYKYLDEEMKYL